MELPLYQVDAFADRPFVGNPAAVVPLDAWLDDTLMQQIAAENNLSETAFLVPVADGEWQIRWFTPLVEVPLCGHATLASAAVIDVILGRRDWPITLHSASGPLVVERSGAGYVLDLPANPPRRLEPQAGIRAALGGESLESWAGGDIHLEVFAGEAEVAALAPDFSALAGVTRHGVIATGPGTDVDFVSRFFAPALGLDEDPVTGAAHCVLGPYWSARLGRTRLAARQISSRPGELGCEQAGARTRLTGRAAFFLSGTIAV